MIAGSTLGEPIHIIDISKNAKYVLPDNIKYDIKIYSTWDSRKAFKNMMDMKGTVAVVNGITNETVSDVIHFHRYSKKPISLPGGRILETSIYQLNVPFPSSPVFPCPISDDLDGVFMNLSRFYLQKDKKTKYSRYLDARHYLVRAIDKTGNKAPQETYGDKLFWKLLETGIRFSEVSVRRPVLVQKRRETRQLLEEFNDMFRESAPGFP